MRVTILSDTHGLLRSEVLDLAQGSDHILHAGDVGDPAILAQLRRIAPVDAVRGNVEPRSEGLRAAVGRDADRSYDTIHSLAELERMIKERKKDADDGR